MNIFKRCFCRVYQGVFRLALPILPYREPEIFNSVEDLPAMFKQKGIDSVLLVTDKFIRSAGITAKLEKALEDNQIRCVVYDDTRANPTVQNVDQAKLMYIVLRNFIQEKDLHENLEIDTVEYDIGGK